jgi:hypothetical protein
MSHCTHRLQILLWSPGKGESESKTRRPEFLSSQLGNSSHHTDKDVNVICALTPRVLRRWRRHVPSKRSSQPPTWPHSVTEQKITMACPISFFLWRVVSWARYKTSNYKRKNDDTWMIQLARERWRHYSRPCLSITEISLKDWGQPRNALVYLTTPFLTLCSVEWNIDK